MLKYMRITIVLVILFSSLFPSVFAYAENLPIYTGNTLKQTQTAKISAIIDPLTMQLTDGALIRLSSIDIPDLEIHEQGQLSRIAHEVLTDMLTGQTVMLHQTPKKDWGRTNRMGHMLAHLSRGEDKVWVQGTLLRLGLARIRTTARTPEMIDEMRRLESLARAEKLGLWSDPQYAIKTLDTIENHLNSFQILEGRVHGVALKKNRLYINFGTNWKTDMTVSIAPEHKRKFTKAGLNPQNWNGKVIRARGWVRAYNGPYMEIDHPEAVEILEE
jgi:micrococcal nuclease